MNNMIRAVLIIIIELCGSPRNTRVSNYIRLGPRRIYSSVNLTF